MKNPLNNSISSIIAAILLFGQLSHADSARNFSEWKKMPMKEEVEGHEGVYDVDRRFQMRDNRKVQGEARINNLTNKEIEIMIFEWKYKLSNGKVLPLKPRIVKIKSKSSYIYRPFQNVAYSTITGFGGSIKILSDD